ncbi:hypothetical protein GIB67_026598 [Kingdonia uniflora]|uniref:Plastid lipid-associated protein/fibrillin conserved domain-containing protein n=1 Tax=Kingdonia uniflora TaxID=39325 RepID=A0A7J7NP31_9MAGN|nr:hypothetical protein GIB67_026598 [Kingdonia uniflora]
MATELLLLQAIPSCHAFPATPKLKTMVLPNTGLSATNLRIKINRFGGYPFRAAASGDVRTTSQIKEDIYQAIQGINRGIFGVPSAKKSEIEGLVKLLESQNPITDPTQYLDKVGGCWKLVYSTISILGSKRTKLGLRDFITLGDFLQTIDVAKGTQTLVMYYARLRSSWEELSHYDSFIEWPASAPSENIPIPPTAAKIYAKILEKTRSRRSHMPPISGIPSETSAMAVRYAYPAPPSVPSQTSHTSSLSLSPLPTASGIKPSPTAFIPVTTDDDSPVSHSDDDRPIAIRKEKRNAEKPDRYLDTTVYSIGKAINVIKFNARGLKMLTGELTIEASFKIVSRSRVDITYENSTITPDQTYYYDPQLLNVFQKNYELLLGIFNPEGSLEISYVDETMRTGRDDKGNMFILERPKQNQGL